MSHFVYKNGETAHGKCVSCHDEGISWQTKLKDPLFSAIWAASLLTCGGCRQPCHVTSLLLLPAIPQILCRCPSQPVGVINAAKWTRSFVFWSMLWCTPHFLLKIICIKEYLDCPAYNPHPLVFTPWFLYEWTNKQQQTIYDLLIGEL